MAQYDRYLEEEQKRDMQKDVITKENIKSFLEALADELIQYMELHPELKETLEDSVVGIADIDKPGEISFEQQKILAEINKYFGENIKEYYRITIETYQVEANMALLSRVVKAMQRFVQPNQELLNHQENITGKMETQIDGDDRDEWFDAFDAKDNDSCINSSESDTDEEFKDANESVSPEESNTLLVPERSQPKNSVKEPSTEESNILLVPERSQPESSVKPLATDQKFGIQKNNQQLSNPSDAAPRSEKRNEALVVAVTGNSYCSSPRNVSGRDSSWSNMLSGCCCNHILL